MTDEQVATPTETTEAPAVQEADNDFAKAEKITADLKAENDRKEALIAREEKLKAKEMLGGKAAAGEIQEKPKEESPKDYAARIMRGEEQ